jgi:hypothetical protein
MTLSRSNPRAKQRWTLLGAVVLVLTLIGVIGAQAAPLNRTLFELDGDATNDTTYTKVGVLNAAVATATDGSTTSITICQEPATFTNGTTILVDAERMTLNGGATAGGGGCPAGFTNKRSYTATRGAGDTDPGAHAKAEDVSLITTGAFAGADWDQVYANIQDDPDSKCDSSALIDLGAVECFYSSDGRSTSIFTQAKDYDEVSDTSGIWQWRDQSVPDANELDDAFAIKYVDGSGDQHLYFGADRFATNGTKDAGFWFFHEDVAALPPVGTADGLFSGVHTQPDPGNNGFCNDDNGGNVPGGQASPLPACEYDDNDTAGDVLILTTFTGGGAVTTVRVFEWIGPSGSVAALLERGVQGDCVPGDGSQELCATVNDTTVETAWPYSGKGEPAANEIPSGGLLEGGINLSARGLEGCFSSFMATTRSSAELTADLKDFILGSFEACDTELTTTPANGLSTPANLTDSNSNGIPDIQIGTGTAGVDVKDKAFIDVKGTPNWAGTLDFYLCGPIDPPVEDDIGTPEDETFEGDLCDTGGVKIGATQNVSSADASAPNFASEAANLTSVGYYCWRGEFLSDTDGVPNATDATRGECFEVLPVTPTLSTTAWSTGDSSGSGLSTPVDFGDPVYDKATLSGTAYQPGNTGHADYPTINASMVTPADGTITFVLVGPDGETVACDSDPDGGDDIASGTGTNPEDVTVNGDGDYFTSGFTPDAPGDYHWKASYTGDDPNTLGTSHNDLCNETAEDVTIQQIPTTIKTQQSWYPNDTATITSTVAGDLLVAGGTVDFFLYDNSSCTGTILYEEQVTLAGGSNSEEVSTSNYAGSTGVETDGTTTVTPYLITTAYADAADSEKGTFYWKVVFMPDDEDTLHTGKQSVCTELFDVTYTNDSGPGTDLP